MTKSIKKPENFAYINGQEILKNLAVVVTKEKVVRLRLFLKEL